MLLYSQFFSSRKNKFQLLHIYQKVTFLHNVLIRIIEVHINLIRIIEVHFEFQNLKRFLACYFAWANFWAWDSQLGAQSVPEFPINFRTCLTIHWLSIKTHKQIEFRGFFEIWKTLIYHFLNLPKWLNSVYII